MVIEEKKDENDAADMIFEVIEKDEKNKLKEKGKQDKYIVDVIVEQVPQGSK